MIAGSSAGFMEHLVMFPVDTIKTRFQVEPSLRGVSTTGGLGTAVLRITSNEGVLRLYRGAPMVVLVAIPSHALYFGAYESARWILGARRDEHNPIKTGLAGVAATAVHDLLVTPVDVLKQRLQMENSRFRSSGDAFRQTTWHQMYRSYPTTVALNIPFVSANFMAYESSKLMLSRLYSTENPLPLHLFCGGVAGGVAGFCSTPLDVVKTRIQTDCACGVRPISCVLKKVFRAEGIRGLFSGATARTVYYIPSAAITWAIYESVKTFLGWEEDLPDEYVI